MRKTYKKSPTTREAVEVFETAQPVFKAVQFEIRELSKKKSDATMSKFKVGQINRVLTDVKEILKDEPEGKYLDLLDDEALPQVGDAVVVMAQYDAALEAFYERHYTHGSLMGRSAGWIYADGEEEDDDEDFGDEDEVEDENDEEDER